MREISDVHFPKADKIRVVMDNLSTHSASALYQTFPPAEARRVLRRLEFHYTPKHASWLNMVEIEIGVLRKQCLDRRIDNCKRLVSEIAAWERHNKCRAHQLDVHSRKGPQKLANAPTPTHPLPKSHNLCAAVLGHFVLVNRIVSLLKPGSRLVNLSSAGHRFANVDLGDPNFEHTPYTEFGAYGRSKTANILFAVEFDRRHKKNGVRATAVHPGVIRTELSRYLTPEVLKQLMDTLNANQPVGAPVVEYKTIPQGAATSVWAGVVAPADLVGGFYCEDCHVAELVENPKFRGGIRAYALDPDRAKALWAKSEEMVNERF